MWWQLQNLLERIENRKTLRKCKRCRMLYKKRLTECPRCAGVTDDDLYLLLMKRSDERISIGKSMFYGMIVIIIVMLWFNAFL